MLKSVQIVISLTIVLFSSACMSGAKLNALSNNLAQNSANNTIDSEYTPLDSESCKTIGLDEETGYSTQSCLGYNNIPVFVSQSDGFHSVSIGEKRNEDLGLIGSNPLGNLGDKLEWRLRDNKPFAAIYRHYTIYFNASEPFDSMLVIRKISENVASCTIGAVDSNVPNANEVARRIADEKSADFECGIDSVERISN